MPYIFLEHVSDVGIQAEGETVEEAFESGAEAVFATFFDLAAVEEKISLSVEAAAPALDLLFVEVLNELISLRDRENLALKRLEAGGIEKTDSGYSFTGTARGEAVDLERHTVKTEVKGATYAGLSYETRDGRHIFKCVLDV